MIVKVIVKVYFNWGRWIADCPSLVCKGAEKLERWQRSSLCRCRDTQICLHGEYCGTIYEVEWPAFADEIEALMGVRPLENRNWWPGETVADLEAENVAHGVA